MNDLNSTHDAQLRSWLASANVPAADFDDMNALMNTPGEQRQALRSAISEGLREGSKQRDAWAQALWPQSSIELTVPCRIGDYTDFCTSARHARRVSQSASGSAVGTVLP
ncbi:fumarylacetoacetase [Variovorax sp. PBS-H4]|uniref:hypothetical protein n=1 Tax=Variovorax sp. PBS-H4 TaxID=434008 RepID=UPI00131689AB|nr:hypothetical protein [Variovorax sp. PBS-H4]VTU21941.1 fumarylacetoacetase [Variovorax sp. PBS-H4]